MHCVKKITKYCTYFCLSALYEDVSSSNNFPFISINVLRTLYTKATIVLRNKNTLETNSNIHIVCTLALVIIHYNIIYLLVPVIL